MVLIRQTGESNPFIQYEHNTGLKRMIKTATKNKNKSDITFLNHRNNKKILYHNGQWFLYDNEYLTRKFKYLKSAIKNMA